MRGLVAVLLLWLALGSAPGRAEWLRAESPNFIVYSEESEARLRERVSLLEDFDRLLRTITNVDGEPAPTKLHIYMVGGSSDLRSIRSLRGSAAGFYSATPSGIAAVAIRNAQYGIESNEILFHEYAHHFMMQYARNAYPAWYVEGFAEFMMTARFRDRSVDVGNYSPARSDSIVGDDWLGMERVLFEGPGDLGPGSIHKFYAQSWLLTHYFYSTEERRQALARYLVEARRGDRAAALQRATGLTPAGLQQELRRYIAGGRITYVELTRDRPQPPDVTITRLPASADDLILQEAALRLGISDEHAPAHLRRIRGAAARHPNDLFAQRLLAHGEALIGDAAAADRLLEALMAAAPDDAQLMYIKGLRHLTAARRGEDVSEQMSQARNWLARAHNADRNHFPTLFLYAQALRGQPNFVSENTQNVLLLAHRLAPQVGDIAIEAATMLLARRQYEDAETILAPLAANPHRSPMVERAQQLLQQARARGQTAAPAAPSDPQS